jgi:RNA polymerase sigma-70 factor (ECF subfamily)
VPAFEQLYARHKRGIHAFCLRTLRDRELAADAAQEIFSRLILTAGDWEPRARFTTWLYTIARNHCHDLLRRRGAQQNRLRGLAELRGSEDWAGAEVDPALRRILVDGVGALPEDQREVFLLRASDLSFEEIGEITRCSPNSVKSRMRLAIARLKEHLSGAGVER